MNKDTIGKRIYKIRKERGLSQEEFANMIGVSRQIVSKWESDSSVPMSDKLKRISDVLNINYDELLNGTVMDNKKNNIIKYIIMLVIFIIISIIIIVIYSNVGNRDSYKCLGTQTYYIDSIYDSEDNNYSYITLIKGDIVKTIKVKKVISNNISEKKSYQFVFRSNDNIDDIEYIFSNNEIINIIDTFEELNVINCE